MDENGQVRYLGRSSGYYLLQNSKTYSNGAFHFTNYGKRSQLQKTRRSTNVDPLELPPKDLSEHLLRLYFKHFYPFLPLFYKRQLFSTVDNPAIDPVAPLLLNAVYAVASRISPDTRVRSDPDSPDTAGDIFFERAEKLLDESYDTPSISTVQALLLLASHQHGVMKSARAWLYSGMAFRMAQDLGLHRDCTHWNISPEECERRRRVFWCCYIVDRLASAMYGRASTFEERDCDVPFPSIDDDDPIQDDDQHSFSLLDAFTNLIKVCDILGHVLKNIYYVHSLQYTGTRQTDTILLALNKKLHQWYDQLPDSLQIKKDEPLPSIAICQLHMIYHTVVILLHRPFIPGPDQILIPTLLPCASVCLAAADAILSVTNSMLAEKKLRYVFNYAVYYIFTSSIIFIKGVHCIKEQVEHNNKSEKSLEAKAKVIKCMQALDEVEITWPTASKSCQILAELSGLSSTDLQQDTNQWQGPSNYFQQNDYTLDDNSERRSEENSLSLKANTSNLRFPIIRVNEEEGHQIEDSARTFYSPDSTQNIEYAFQILPAGSFSSNNTNTAPSTMDPFAAPGIIPVSSTRQYDPLVGTSFWGVPSSLDANEWNNFMDSSLNGQQQDPFAETNCLQEHRLIYEDNLSNSHIINEYQSFTSQQQEKQHLIHTDQHVDILSGISLPLEQQTIPSAPNNDTLVSYLRNTNTSINNPTTITSTSSSLSSSSSSSTTTTTNTTTNTTTTTTTTTTRNIPPPPLMDSRSSNNTKERDISNAYYW
ncbi:fungal-specific transcription factor domain-containing protein [Cokeromyces recurvatus]|uniref:fungal-specific transcription factor domain-containing protein n=1 Tax=Cokeromyces recurvatus TaxID=90255 RepID=UPI00221FB745|nr:fungal-specific transcription factor domain-containing protein [Cokeromyces recurvatus]KAI7898774.1 fungal-specific transcription factor domain-containing protein [Cokeromyces recurvatus]